MGCVGYIKAVKLDRKGMLLLAKHLLHIKKKNKMKIRPTAVSLTEYKMRKKNVSIKEDTLKKEDS